MRNIIIISHKTNWNKFMKKESETKISFKKSIYFRPVNDAYSVYSVHVFMRSQFLTDKR